MENKKLTPRQWATYNLIKNASSRGESATIEQIIANYPESAYKDGYRRSERASHDPCKSVWHDIVALNASSEIEKIIIIDNFTYRLATEEEAEAYYQTLKDKALRAFNRAYNIRRKIRKDGQGKLISCQGAIIVQDSTARRFVEAFKKADKSKFEGVPTTHPIENIIVEEGVLDEK